MQATLIVGGMLALATSAVYVYVGTRVQQRSVGGDGRLAQNMFLVWWYALGLSTFTGGLQTLSYAGGILTVPLYETLRAFNLILVIAALLGLLYYLLYLYTGSKRGILPLVGAYTLLWAYITWAYAVNPVDALSDDGWAVAATPEPLTGGALIAILLFVVGPQIVAAIALLLLLRKVDNPTQTYRLGLVSTAILVWFSSALIASLVGISDLSWWPLVSRLIGLTAALTTLAAYNPPRFIQRKYGISPLGDGA